ncbi:hypothetical protein [Geodermatophilus sp. SYSU D00766]
MGLTASEGHPEAGWTWAVLLGLSRYGWLPLAPLVLLGAVVTAVLARFED